MDATNIILFKVSENAEIAHGLQLASKKLTDDQEVIDSGYKDGEIEH